MADKRNVRAAIGPLAREAAASYATDPAWDYWLYYTRVACLKTWEAGEESGFLSWSSYEIKSPYFELGYRSINKGQFYTMFNAARNIATLVYSNGITLPAAPTDYDLNVYALYVEAAGVKYKLVRKPQPTATEIRNKTPNTANEEILFTATNDALQIGGVSVPYADITAVYPVIIALKSLPHPLY